MYAQVPWVVAVTFQVVWVEPDQQPVLQSPKQQVSHDLDFSIAIPVPATYLLSSMTCKTSFYFIALYTLTHRIAALPRIVNSIRHKEQGRQTGSRSSSMQQGHPEQAGNRRVGKKDSLKAKLEILIMEKNCFICYF